MPRRAILVDVQALWLNSCLDKLETNHLAALKNAPLKEALFVCPPAAHYRMAPVRPQNRYDPVD
jgi:hypothetical protein